MVYKVLAVALLLLSVVADSVVYTLSAMLDGALVAGAFFLFWLARERKKDV